MPKPGPASDAEQEPLYEELVQCVEEIVARLEEGSLGLNESIEQYETGIKYLQRCVKMLDEAERMVALLTGVDPSGRAEVEPYRVEDDATLEAKADRRSRRRSSPRRDTAEQESLFDDQ